MSESENVCYKPHIQVMSKSELVNTLRLALPGQSYSRSWLHPSSHISTIQPPADRTHEIINKLPSSLNLITKTGTAILESGLLRLAAAISQELYVMNEDSVVAIVSFILSTYLTKAARKRYKTGQTATSTVSRPFQQRTFSC
jgi:Mitochondrial ATP synthase B chain precursor (ATP-synt_B)